MPSGARPQRAGRRVGCAGHGGAPFRRSVGVGHRDIEALGEAGHIVGRTFIAKDVEQRVVGIVGLFGGGQDVGQGFADVIEVGGAGRPYVGQEGRGGEPTRRREREGRSRHEGRGPARHEGIGVEERHGEVADVCAPEAVPRRQALTDAGHPALAAQAGLGRPRGSRGEQQIAEGPGRDRSIERVGCRGTGEAVEGAVGVRSIEDQRAGAVRRHRTEAVPDAQALDEGKRTRVGDEQLALGVGEVPLQFVAPVRGIRPDHHRSGQRRRLEPVDELGHVVEQDRHVEGPGTPIGLQPGRPLCGSADHLGVGEPEVSRDQARGGVTGPVAHGLGNCLRLRHHISEWL